MWCISHAACLQEQSQWIADLNRLFGRTCTLLQWVCEVGGVFTKTGTSFDGWNNATRLKITFSLEFKWLARKFLINSW